MAAKKGLRAQEVEALRRALETERAATRAALERAKELQAALEGERSAGRALRRQAAAEARAVRQQEADKYAELVEQLKTRMELTQSELVGTEKEKTARGLNAQFQRELVARQEEWKRESKQQLECLQEQLREAQRASLEASPRRETEVLVHSLHAEFNRTLHQRQEEWRRESKAQVDVLTNQLRDLQRIYTETCNKLTTTTNEAETIPKLRQEIQNLKITNKELEEKVQVLTEGERRKAEEFRAQHDEYNNRVAELQRTARRETFQLLEEIKSKTRAISQLQREYHFLSTRLSGEPSPSHGRSPSRLGIGLLESSRERPGEPSRICVKRPKSLTFASDLNKRQRALEGRKPPDPPEPDGLTPTHVCEKNDVGSNSTLLLEPLKEKTTGTPETSDVINNWTKTVGVETLYQLLLEEHQELQVSHHHATARLREEERTRLQLEERLRECQRPDGDNGINLALAEQIRALQEKQAELESEAQDLREQNDLLEFRILELDDGGCAHSCSSYHFKSPSSRSPDTRDRELDDVSDSGVMSLPTSEDISESDFQDFKMEPNNRDVKSRLAGLCQSLESVAERIVTQQALALLRHYEARIESLDATLAAMCQDATPPKNIEHQPLNTEHAKSPSRIIATVLPFTDLSRNYHGKDMRDNIPLKRLLRDQDCMQESGIFEDGALSSCLLNVGTQTDWTVDPPPGDLGAEIRKLTQIRERMEEKGGNKRLLKSEAETEFLTHASLKELLFYRERVNMLEEKVAVYESRGDEQSRLLAMRLEKEVLLAAQVKHIQASLRKSKDLNRILEEEKCEFEEAENDTRLRCQKLEVKLSALGEKKSDLQVQLQQNARTMSNLRSSLSEEERKRNEARQYAAKMEALANRLEQQNFEIEEREIEIRYQLHALENLVPAMVMYYLWRMLNAMRPFVNYKHTPLSVHSSLSDSILAVKAQTLKVPCYKRLRNNRNQRSVESQEYLEISLRAIEHFLSLKQKGEHPEIPNIAVDAAFLVIEELSDRCRTMEDRIKELELKEKVYQETLQNGDDILNKMDMDHKQQIRLIEDELFLKKADLDKAESLLRKYSGNRDLEIQLQERISQLESELSEQYVVSAQKEKDKKLLEGENKRLTKEIEEAIDNIDKYKENVEKPLKEDLEHQKKKVRDLLGDLDIHEQEKEESDEMHWKLVKELKKINNQACRQLEESEVTIGELREEVQTLEREVGDLRAALCAERDHSERLMIRASVELEAKERELRLMGGVGGVSPAGSLHEELLHAEAERPIDCESNADATAPAHPTDRQCECQVAEQLIQDFDLTKGQDLLDTVISAYHHSRICRKCKSSTTVELRRILNILQKTAPLSKMAGEWLSKASGGGSSAMRGLLHSLLAKCRVKDHMIRCLADQLRLCPHHHPPLFRALFTDPLYTLDFTRSVLYEYINDTLGINVASILEGDYDPGYSSSHPLLLRVVDRPDPLSLTLAWTQPSSNHVTGFQLIVDNKVYERIYSGARISTILCPVEVAPAPHSPLTLTIRAFQRDGSTVQEHSIRYP